MGYFFVFMLYALLAYGLTNLLVNGRGPFGTLTWFRKVANRFSHELGKMLECMMCTSTNVGLILSVIDLCLAGVAFTPFNVIFPSAYWWLIIPFDMFITSGIVWIINAVELWFEDKQLYIDVNTGDNNQE